MTSNEALSGLASILGGGGIVSVIIAYLGFKQEAMKGRRDPDGKTVALAIGDVYADKRDREALTAAIDKLTAAVIRYADMMQEATERKDRDRELKVLIAEMRGDRDRRND